MKRCMAVVLVASLTLGTFAPAARAAVNVSRDSAENPVVEVSKSIVYGGLAGLVLGSAIALASDGSRSDGDVIRWCFVGGTVLGAAAGIYFVASRPGPDAMMQIEGGALKLHAPALAASPGGGAQLPLVAVRF